MKLNKKGVSLPELLAVIVIMGLIAAISIPAFSSMIKNAKKDKTLSEAKQLYSKIESTITSMDAEPAANGTLPDDVVDAIFEDYNNDVPFITDSNLSLNASVSTKKDLFKLIIHFLGDRYFLLDLGGKFTNSKLAEFDFDANGCDSDGAVERYSIDDFTRACIK